MKLDLLSSGKEAAWLVAHPGVLALTWGQGLTGGQGDGERLTQIKVCGLKAVELSNCPPGSFHVTHRRPIGT